LEKIKMPAGTHDHRFDITSDSNLEAILQIAFARHKTAKGWRIDGKRLLLSWSNDGDRWNSFLTPTDASTAVAPITAWLKSQKYGTVPPCDGSVVEGFRVYNENWGHIGDDHYAFVAIEPELIIYGK
jgi:hypothetical protein